MACEDINLAFFNKKKYELYKMLKHCKETIPYYGENWNFEIPNSIDDFDYSFFSREIPLLEKDIVKNNSENFISNIFSKNDLVYEATSGTEGKPLVCYKSKNEKFLYSRTLWEQRCQRAKNLIMADKYARFYSFRRERNIAITDPIFYNDNVLHLSLFDLSLSKLEMYWNTILAYKPKWLLGVPSAVHNLALVVQQKGLPRCNLDLIELTGEYVSEEDLNFIKDTFKCEVGNHYGAREFWAIAYSCNENHLHVLDKNVFVETIYNDEYSCNEIIVTTLKNKSWGLVRYRIGDLGDLDYTDFSKCEYPNKFCLKIKKGRKTEYCTLDNGKVISPILFSFICRRINELEKSKIVKQYQVIKVSGSYLKINLTCNNSLGDREKVANYYKNELQKVVGDDIFIDLNFTSYIPLDNDTGKYNDFIDLAKK